MKIFRLLLCFVLLLQPAFLHAQDYMDDTVEDAPVPKPKPADKPVRTPKDAPTSDEAAPPPLPAGSMVELPYAELQALDKITARVSHLEVKVGDTVTFGSLNITVKTCRKSPPEDPPEAVVFLQVWEQKPSEESHWVYSGWMFASSPALAAMDHPVYDIWPVDCSKVSTSAVSPAEPSPQPPK